MCTYSRTEKHAIAVTEAVLLQTLFASGEASSLPAKTERWGKWASEDAAGSNLFINTINAGGM